jgi:hypothetical protein
LSGDQRIHDSERQQRIDEIKRLIEAVGFVAKDFFLTQPPPPEGDAYAGWKAREVSRQRIARRMYHYGFSTHDLMGAPRTAPVQIDMFPAAVELTTEPATGHELVGLAITLPEQCLRCRGHDAWIGAGRGPHKASVLCACGRHLGWLSIATFNFINATVQQFGRPTEPICVSRHRATADVSRPVNANATKE